MSQASQQRTSKAQKRAARIAAAARRKRLRALAGAGAGVAVVGIIVASILIFGRSDDDGTAGAGAPSASASAAPTAEPSAANFPPLPPGADPALGTKPTVTKGSGKLTKLTVETLIEGTGPAVQAGQTITVNYVGVFYETGEEFQASWNSGEVLPTQIGAGQVIAGWDQGLVGVKVGSRVQLDIPADLAYGENPTGGKPAGPLRFVVDILAAQ